MWSTLTPLLRFNKILGTILWVLFLVLTDVCVQINVCRFCFLFCFLVYNKWGKVFVLGGN